jgi:hypothetical protein
MVEGWISSDEIVFVTRSTNLRKHEGKSAKTPANDLNSLILTETSFADRGNWSVRFSGCNLILRRHTPTGEPLGVLNFGMTNPGLKMFKTHKKLIKHVIACRPCYDNAGQKTIRRDVAICVGCSG